MFTGSSVRIPPFLVGSPIINESHLAWSVGQEHEFSATISSEVEQAVSFQRFVVSDIQLSGNRGFLKGKVLVKTRLYPEFHKGERVWMRCQLQKPEAFAGGFVYDKYLEMSGIYALCYYPQISLQHRTEFKFGENCDLWASRCGARRCAKSTAYCAPRSWLHISSIFTKHDLADFAAFKSAILFRIKRLIPEPEASFLAGILLGERTGIDPVLVQAFNRTGNNAYYCTLAITSRS